MARRRLFAEHVENASRNSLTAASDHLCFARPLLTAITTAFPLPDKHYQALAVSLYLARGRKNSEGGRIFRVAGSCGSRNSPLARAFIEITLDFE